MIFHQVKKRNRNIYSIQLLFMESFASIKKKTRSPCYVQYRVLCLVLCPMHSILTVRTTPDTHLSQPRNTLAVPYCYNTVSPHGGSVSPSPNKPAIYSWRFLVFPVPFFFLFFFSLFFLFFSFFSFFSSSQGLVATLPRHRSPFPFLLAATAGFWCPVSRPAPNGA